MDIPEHILKRLEFTRSKDRIEHVTFISHKPSVCSCGETLGEPQKTWIRLCRDPMTHYRESCRHCPRMRQLGEERWFDNSHKLTAWMRTAYNLSRSKTNKNTKDK